MPVKHLKIKICGLRDVETAKKSVEAGADFIGFIFHPPSKRYIEIEPAIHLSHAIKQEGGTPVAVFVNHTADEMRLICELTDIQVVQLHGDIARAHHHKLPNHFQRIYVQNIDNDGLALSTAGFNYLNPERDQILFDHMDAGYGKSITHIPFKPPENFSWFIAGGLTANNVANVIEKLQPDGVDVSSHVEKNGQKNINLIQVFIHAAKGVKHE